MKQGQVLKAGPYHVSEEARRLRPAGVLRLPALPFLRALTIAFPGGPFPMITGQRGFFSGQGSASRARRGCAFIVTLEDGHGPPTLDKGGKGAAVLRARVLGLFDDGS